MELHLDNMLEVSELICALKARQKYLYQHYPWENDKNSLAKTAIHKIIEQVKDNYPYMFDEEE